MSWTSNLNLVYSCYFFGSDKQGEKSLLRTSLHGLSAELAITSIFITWFQVFFFSVKHGGGEKRREEKDVS